MFGELIVMVLLFLGGIGAILFSILSWKLRSDVFFYLGIVFTALILIYILVNIEYVYYLLTNPGTAIIGIMTLSFVVIPVIFLIQSKQKNGPGSNDNDVTEAYLDEIINSDDEWDEESP